MLISFKRFSITNIKRASTQTFMSKKLDIRPTVDDVERISRGQAAKRRGTGSRNVPHRLNAAEVIEWNLAKSRRFLLLRGSGWRRERGDSPLANIYRNYCDAVAVPCISVERSVGIDVVDNVIIDFSPMRTVEIASLVEECMAIARQYASLMYISDQSKLDSLGWENPQAILDTHVIWRIPVYSVVASFSNRSDSRGFAEELAIKVANGKSTKKKSSEDDDIDEGDIPME